MTVVLTSKTVIHTLLIVLLFLVSHTLYANYAAEYNPIDTIHLKRSLSTSRLQDYFAAPQWDRAGRENYKHYSEGKLRDLAVCVATDTCRENQTSVVILAYWHAHAHIYEGYNGGEGVWTHSLVDSLETYAYAKYLYNQIPDLVKAVIGTEDGGYGRAMDVMKSEEQPDGIPKWKWLVYNYFSGETKSPVGDAWNIFSELGYNAKAPNATHIPYAITPTQADIIPFEQRPNRIYILAKYLTYFYAGCDPAWPDISFFSRAKAELSNDFPGFEFVGGFTDPRFEEEKEASPLSLPKGVVNLGKLNAEEFELEMAKSKGLLGIGWPTDSPSPHLGLSLGVPFINPHKMFGHSTDEDKNSWWSVQHRTLLHLDEPYTYNPIADNYEQFVLAIRSALSHPVEPFVFPFMTQQASHLAVGEMMRRDWRSEAQAILEDRQRGVDYQVGNGEIFLM